MQRQNRHDGPGAGAAGIGKILHAPLVSQLRDPVRTGDLVEVYVGALGEGGVPAELTAQVPQVRHRHAAQAGEGDDGVGQAGGSQLYIGAGPDFARSLHRAVQTDDAGVGKTDTVVSSVDAAACHNAGGGLHCLLLSGKAVLKAVTANAAGSVAAHLSLGAVGVIEQHPIVAALAGCIHHHKAVGANGEMTVAEGSGQGGKYAMVQVLGQVIENNEVIAGPIHFGKAHGSPPFL